ncbi:MAG: hypothetical protein WKG01_11830 [Kofleriaceae bacterium]
MPHRHGLRAIGLIAVSTLLAVGCESDKLKGPEAEVRKSDVKLNLPPVPGFELPPPATDGTHSVKELRVKGRKLLETPIKVKGFVTWAYDCPTALRAPGQSDTDVQKLIDEDPTRCERAKFYIGDEASTPAEKSLWIVDVPRPYNKKEIKNIDKKNRVDPDRCEPDEKKKDPMKSICPPYKVGDQVEIEGTFSLSSPHSERNSQGLLVFKRMKNVTQGYESPAPKVDPNAAGTPPAGAPGTKMSPEDMVKKTQGNG